MRTLVTSRILGAGAAALCGVMLWSFATPAAAAQVTLSSVRLNVQDTLSELERYPTVNAGDMAAIRQQLALISSELRVFQAVPEVPALRQRVQDLLNEATLQDSLSGAGLAAMENELNAVGTDLKTISSREMAADALASYNDGWSEYSGAGGDVWPYGSTFNGWQAGRSFNAETDDVAGELVLTVENGYTARWVIDAAYGGTPEVTAFPQDNGDLYVTVRSDWGERDFLIENGGTGPLDFGGLTPQPVAVEETQAYAPVEYPAPDNDIYLNLDVTVLPWAGHLFSPNHTWHGHEGEDHHGHHSNHGGQPGDNDHGGQPGDHGNPGQHQHQHQGGNGNNHGNGNQTGPQQNNHGQQSPVTHGDQPVAPPVKQGLPPQAHPVQVPDHAQPAHHTPHNSPGGTPPSPPPPAPVHDEHVRQTQPVHIPDHSDHSDHHPAPAPPAPAPPPPPPPPPPRNTDRQTAPPQHQDHNSNGGNGNGKPDPNDTHRHG